MNNIYRSIQSSFKWLCVGFVFLNSLNHLCAQPISSAELPTLAPTNLDMYITRVTVRLMLKQHYMNKKLDDKFSEMLFKEYFERLDPNHYYFLQEDLDNYIKNKTLLDDYLAIGNLEFAFSVYNLYLKRIRDRVEFVKKAVNESFDFDTDEKIIIDRTELPWAEDVGELNDIWRKRIKNHLLVNKFLIDSKEDKGEEKNNFETKPLTSEERVVKKYTQYYSYFSENDNADVMEYFLSAVLYIFDPHSSYLNWRSLEDFNIAMKLSLQGIGATLKYVDGYTEVVNLIAGGPAERDGRLQPGDRIIAVAQGSESPIDVVDMPLNKVVRKIRGTKDTEVRLTVIKSLHGAPSVINLIRDKVKLKDQEAKGRVEKFKVDNKLTLNLGVIDIPSFYADFEGLKNRKKDAKSTSSDVKKIIDGMIKNDNIDGVLIDLRSNGGGSLEEAINLTGLFIPEGPVVQVRSRQGVKVRGDNDDGFSYDLPLVVLVNKSSASASEIFSGAIQDYDRGIVVGDINTHGKGTVQTILKLNRIKMLKDKKSGAMKYTMAKFYRVTGASTQKKGVTPSIIFPSFLDHMEIGESHLKHVMPWDEIKPLPVEKEINISNYIDRIKKNATTRLEKNKKFQELRNDIEKYGIRKKEKSISLNKDKRLAMKKEDEYWAERSKSILGKRNKDKKGKKNKNKDKTDKTDIYLKQTLFILADLIEARENKGSITAVSSSKTPLNNNTLNSNVDTVNKGTY